MKFEYSFKIFWILNFWSYRLRIWSDWADDPNKAHWHWCIWSRTTDTQWNHNSKFFENFSRFGRQNILRPYLKICEWDWIFGRAVKAISSLGVRSWCIWCFFDYILSKYFVFMCSYSWYFIFQQKNKL